MEHLKSSGGEKNWLKLLPKPGPYDPKDCEQEVATWKDSRCKVCHGNQDQNFEADEKKRPLFLYGLLVSLLRGRLLSVLRGVERSNGYEALRQLMLQCQPSSRNRSLGMLRHDSVSCEPDCWT